MRSKIIVGLILLSGCSPARVDPEFSLFFGDPNQPTWVYLVEEKIRLQFAEKGLRQVPWEESEMTARGIFGTWIEEDGHCYSANRFLKYIVDPNTTLEHDTIYGKMLTKPENRKIAWYFLWSRTEPGKVNELVKQTFNETFLKKIYKK